MNGQPNNIKLNFLFFVNLFILLYNILYMFLYNIFRYVLDLFLIIPLRKISRDGNQKSIPIVESDP